MVVNVRVIILLHLYPITLPPHAVRHLVMDPGEVGRVITRAFSNLNSTGGEKERWIGL